MLSPRVVIVTRKTEFERLIERHGTKAQADFFLRQRGQTLEEIRDAHERTKSAVAQVASSAPVAWRQTRVLRQELDRFLFTEDDIIVAVGQDGLVANVAKYLHQQPVIGVNPLCDFFDGILVPHAPDRVEELLQSTVANQVHVEERTMTCARLDDGQILRALNEIFVGHQSHQSARYRISIDNQEERHSSSGLIVTTGTGATGWARSIALTRETIPEIPVATEPQLAFFVREAFPSRRTQTSIECGNIAKGCALSVTSEMQNGGVIFGDGMESDCIRFGWGQTVEIYADPQALRLVV